MDNDNQHPTNGSHLSSSPADDKKRVSSTLTQTEEIQGTNELFWEFAYRNEVPRLTYKINQLCQEITQLHHEKLVLEFQNIQLKEVKEKQNGGFDGDSKIAFEDDIARKRNDGLEAPNQRTLEMISAFGKQQGDHKETHAREIVKPESKIDDLQPLVIKKLLHDKNQNVWLGYLTLKEDEKPKTIWIANSDLVIDGIVSQKKLILEEFLIHHGAYPLCYGHVDKCNGRFDVSHLLQKVQTCNITDLILFKQNLVWKEFEKLVSSKMVILLYMLNVQIIDEKNNLVSIEKILEYAPNVEIVAYFNQLNKETFKNLLKLPAFVNLREFEIDNVFCHDFDAESFLSFMKKHPAAQFTLEFRLFECNQHAKAEYQKIKRMLESRAPIGKLLIKSR